MSTATAPNARVGFAFAIALFLIWVFATYLLEGRILTLQRPDATGARLAYALIANLLIGIGGGALAVCVLSNSGMISWGSRASDTPFSQWWWEPCSGSSSTLCRGRPPSTLWSSSTPTLRSWWYP